MGHARAHSGTSWDIGMSHVSPSGGHSAHMLWAERDGVAEPEAPANLAGFEGGLLAPVSRRKLTDCSQRRDFMSLGGRSRFLTST